MIVAELQLTKEELEANRELIASRVQMVESDSRRQMIFVSILNKMNKAYGYLEPHVYKPEERR